MMNYLLVMVTVVVHFLFICFVIIGGLLVWRWPRLVWLHLPAVAWGALVQLMNWPCPLTPLENYLRRTAGEQGYSGGFIEHYLIPVIYPAGLTVEVHIVLGVLVLAINAGVYALLLRRYVRGKG